MMTTSLSRQESSIGIVAVFVELGIFSGKGDAKLVDNVFRAVDVAEARESLLAETIIVLDDTPNEEAVLQFIGKNGSDTLCRCRSWRQNDLPVRWLFYREIFPFGISKS